jgi:hypothetical protein
VLVVSVLAVWRIQPTPSPSAPVTVPLPRRLTPFWLERCEVDLFDCRDGFDWDSRSKSVWEERDLAPRLRARECEGGRERIEGVCGRDFGVRYELGNVGSRVGGRGYAGVSGVTVR